MIDLPEADILAKLNGQQHAEGLVRHLEALEKAKSEEFDKILAGDAIDFEADKAEPAKPNELEEISKIADRHRELLIEIQDQSDYLATLNKELFEIEMATLPNIMERLGLTLFKTASGLVVEIKKIIQANLPAAGTIDQAKGEEKALLELRLAEGLQYLRDHEGESLIKSQVQVTFGKGESAIKQAFFDQTIQNGYKAISVDGVHPQTLTAWVKEKLANGVSVPFDTFKIYDGNKAIVKPQATGKK